VAVYQVVKKGDSVLREKAKNVGQITPNILKLLDNLRDTMYAANGVGLAAPQIGVSKRVIVVDAEDELLELINPEVVKGEGIQVDAEGCLSVPGLIGDVSRYYLVCVRGLNRDGEAFEISREGLAARALQHEIDHLDGILFIDKAEDIRPVD